MPRGWGVAGGRKDLRALKEADVKWMSWEGGKRRDGEREKERGERKYGNAQTIKSWTARLKHIKS